MQPEKMLPSLAALLFVGAEPLCRAHLTTALKRRPSQANGPGFLHTFAVSLGVVSSGNLLRLAGNPGFSALHRLVFALGVVLPFGVVFKDDDVLVQVKVSNLRLGIIHEAGTLNILLPSISLASRR
jgi:hypothetical protein